MVINPAQHVIRRLTKAEGYLELGMPVQALLELEAIDNPGPFSIPHLWMTAAALKAQGRFKEAIAPLRKLARSLPKIGKGSAWKSLAQCMKQAGQPGGVADIEKLLSTFGLAPASTPAGTEPAASEETAQDNTIRIDIPHFGTLSLKIEEGQSLTIKIERPKSDSAETSET